MTLSASNDNPSLFSSQPALEPDRRADLHPRRRRKRLGTRDGRRTRRRRHRERRARHDHQDLHDHRHPGQRRADVQRRQGTSRCSRTPARRRLGWVTSQSPGAANESAQQITYSATNDNHGALHRRRPADDRDRRDTDVHARRVNAAGSAQLTVTAHDDGGTANGGHDTRPANVHDHRHRGQPCADLHRGRQSDACSRTRVRRACSGRPRSTRAHRTSRARRSPSRTTQRQQRPLQRASRRSARRAYSPTPRPPTPTAPRPSPSPRRTTAAPRTAATTRTTATFTITVTAGQRRPHAQPGGRPVGSRGRRPASGRATTISPGPTDEAEPERHADDLDRPSRSTSTSPVSRPSHRTARSPTRPHWGPTARQTSPSPPRTTAAPPTAARTPPRSAFQIVIAPLPPNAADDSYSTTLGRRCTSPRRASCRTTPTSTRRRSPSPRARSHGPRLGHDPSGRIVRLPAVTALPGGTDSFTYTITNGTGTPRRARSPSPSRLLGTSTNTLYLSTSGPSAEVWDLSASAPPAATRRFPTGTVTATRA